MKTLMTIWNVLATALLVLALLLVIAFAGLRLVGLTPYVVTSGSMEPLYPVGSIVYVQEAAPEEVQPGDSITFHLSSGSIATHQVWQVDAQERTFRTQGINNLDGNGEIIHDAAPVPFDDLIGKPVLCVPGLGCVYELLQKPAGMCVVALVVALAILSAVLSPAKGEASGRKKVIPSSDVTDR